MRAVDRTTKLFIASLTHALPNVSYSVSRSKNAAGRSHYVYIYTPKRSYKVRISDHAVGMRRALRGDEDLYVTAGASPASWAVWLGDLTRALGARRDRALL